MHLLNNIWRVFLLLHILITPLTAKRNLKATSLVTCMENSQLVPESFNVYFDPSNRGLHYNLKINSKISGNIVAYIDVYAYGFKIISRTEDACSLGWKQFCPLTPGNIEINSIEYVSEHYANMIPGIAYQVPDIDAYVRLKIIKSGDTSKTQVACIEAFFTNGKSVAQTGVMWVTAIIAGIGLITSALLSAFGSSIAASHISANTMSLFLYFQSVVLVCLQHVDYLPPIASAWSRNLAWSMGLIKTTFMQKIFRWYVQSTGGTPNLYLTSTSDAVLVQKKRKRDLLYLAARNIVKRSKANILYGNSNVKIFRGIKRMGYSMGIEATSIVATGLTFFLFCGYALAILIIGAKLFTEMMVKFKWFKPNKFIMFRQSWKMVLKGALLKYSYIGFTQLCVLCIWEYFERDSPALIVMACLFLITIFTLMIWTFVRTFQFGRKSVEQYNNPAAILYGDQQVVDKYSWFYSMFRAEYYWWGGVILSVFFAKALVIACGQGSGKAQCLIFFIIDLAYFITIIRIKPYLDRVTNIINILMQTVSLVNSFLFLFFSNLFGQPAPVASIMAWVFFILNAAFSFILLMMILFYTILVLGSKNPDLRFKPVKDDRMAFKQVNDPDANLDNELFALGETAKEHGNNWEDGLQDQKYKFDEIEKEENYRNSLLYNNNNANSKSGLHIPLSVQEDGSPSSTNPDEDEKTYQMDNSTHPGLKSRLKSFTDKIKRNNTVLSRHSTKSVLSLGANKSGLDLTASTDNFENIKTPESQGLLKSYESVGDLKEKIHKRTESDISVAKLKDEKKQQQYSFI